MFINLPQQVGDFFIGVLILVAPIGHEEVHDSVVGMVVGNRVELHKVLILWHLVLLRYRHQHLDRRHEW